MAKFSTEEQVSFLLKKNLGKPSTDASIPFYSEPAIDARPKVFTSQIYSSDIPTTRPTSGWSSSSSGDVPGDLADGAISTHSGGVLRYYHKWPLVKVTNGNDMAFKAAADTTSSPNLSNPLQGSVPFNLDAAGGYGVLLYRNSSGSAGSQIFDGTGEWVIDPDAGVLTFYHQSDVSGYVDESKPPFLSFFAYVGSTGLAAASPWTEVSDGIHYSDSNKTVLIGRSSSSSTGTFDLEVGADANSDTKFHGRVRALQVICSSDRRLKKNIRQIRRPLTKLTGVRGVSFTWRKTGEKSYGVIADEIESQLPGSSFESADGSLGVNYNAAIALLIETAKAQAGQIFALQSKVKALEKKLKQRTL